ncbi:WD repeat-containing protein 60 isoform X2 [Oryzias latipes]|uniref:WD repeat-containing protein 60 isoform X2 n=1 Tax=Oryzias latipes TaxID=8090 RepID=UPI0005CB9DAA|nr:WD repeat-containing protein 60 isoform X2 [Oryzias latipes]
MHSEKKITKDDTWRPADLRRHIRETGDHRNQGDHYVKRKEDSERKGRGGESTERRQRDSEESRQERHLTREREVDAERRRRASSRHRDGDEKDREKRRTTDSDRERSSRRGNREDLHFEKEKVRDREKHTEEDREKIRQDRDKDRTQEEREREKRKERRRYEESRERKREPSDNQRREERDGHYRIDHEGKVKRRDIEGLKHSERKEERESKEKHRKHREEREYKEERRKHREERAYKEEHQKRKEEREKKHRGAEYYDEKQKDESESKERRDSKGSGEKVKFSQSDRGREEREKHKEKKGKNEEEDGRKYKERRRRDEEHVHSDRSISKKSSSDKHVRKTTEAEESNVLSDQWAAEVKDEEDGKEPVDEEVLAEYYEEDFEDYEEDFEEESADEREEEKEPLKPAEKEELTLQEQKEIEAIQRAMAEENKRAGTAQSRQTVRQETEDRLKWNKDSEESQIKASQRGKFIDFVAAKRREVSKKDAVKQMRRCTDLRRLIDLDFSVTFSLLDLPPVSEYELYIRNFGSANTKQAYAQCNEDNTERDIQTEGIEMCEKWTQHPSQHSGACGDSNLAQGARERTRQDLNFDSQRLTSFLQSASQVMLVLLEEDQAERKSQIKLKTQPDSLSFSEGSLQINTKLPFLFGRQVSLVHFSQVQRHTMLSVHMPISKPSAVRLDSNAIICIWNIWEPSRPQKILLYESEVQCCCFSPGKAILVFAGTSVGSVVLWDLREPASNHYSLKIGENEWTVRQPTFSTDAVMAGTGHLSPVTSVEVVPSVGAGATSFLSPDDESSGLTFQLASLDESGVLNFWVVVELPKGSEAGSPTDLGLWPGGKVKLLHSSAILTSERSSQHNAVKTEPLEALLLKFLPTDSNHFFLGTNRGLVRHGTTFGLKASPRFYRFQEVEERPVDVCSIHFSPFRPDCFLVGCMDGSIRMHTVSRERPVAEWSGSTAGEPVLSVEWAQTRPTVFCVLDAASNLQIWDLMKNEAQPVITERMSDDRLTAVSVFGDSGQQNIYSGIALAHESGKIELLYFTKGLTEPCSGEAEKLDCLINNAI